MHKRNFQLYIEDILDSIKAIETYLADISSFEDFISDRKTYSATLREYIVIGEAITPLIKLLENRFPDYDWRMIKDFRNFIVHEYFGVDLQIIWDISTLELDQLKKKITLFQKDINST